MSTSDDAAVTARYAAPPWGDAKRVTPDMFARPCPVISVRPTHTITEKPWDDGSSIVAHVEWHPVHGGEQLECGGYCCLAPNHVGPCECGGDEPGCPGSCPA